MDASVKLKFGAAHDEGREEVEGFRGVGCRKIGDLFVNELIGLDGDVAADEGRLEDVESNVLPTWAGRRLGGGPDSDL